VSAQPWNEEEEREIKDSFPSSRGESVVAGRKGGTSDAPREEGGRGEEGEIPIQILRKRVL